MTLAQLYGRGTKPSLVTVTGATVRETAIATGYGEGVRVELRYENGGWAKLDCYPTLVYWQTLRSEADEPTGLYDLLARVTPPFFKERGVERYLASPASDEGEAVLKRRLAWRDVDGLLETAL